MAGEVANTSYLGPTNGWDGDEVASMDTDVPKIYSRRPRPPPDYVGQETAETDVALIGTDDGKVWCSSAVVRANAPELAKLLPPLIDSQSPSKTQVKMPLNTDRLGTLVAALERDTSAKIAWYEMSLDDLLEVTNMFIKYKVFLWCHGTMEQRLIDMTRHESVEDCGRYENGDPTVSRLFNVAHGAGFTQLKALCIEKSPAYASSKHHTHEGDDRPRKKRVR